ncbi:stabilizer of axonemal microtubules 4 isoform 4-T4 [Alca torda]
MRGKFWGHSITATLASQRSHCQDTARSTAAEHFQPLMLPDGRSLLPRHVHQPGSGYLQASSLSCLRTEAVSPQHPPLLQGRPSAPGEHSTGSRRTGPAQPDVLQKTTIGTKEQSGFTRATPRSDSVLPALPGQPLAVSVTATDYLPSARSHVSGARGGGGEAGPPVGRAVAWGRGHRVPVTSSPSSGRAARRSRRCRQAPSEAAGSAGRCRAAWGRRACPPWATPSRSSPEGCRHPE